MDKTLQDFLLKCDDYKPHSSITREIQEGEYACYVNAARDYKPETVLEVGVLFGFSAMAMFWGHIAIKKFLGIDSEVLRDSSNDIALRNIWRVLHHFGKTEKDIDVAMTYSGEGITEQFDLVHIDADHSFKEVYKDLTLYYPLAKRVVLMHDYLSPKNQGVREAIHAYEKEIGGFKKTKVYEARHGVLAIEKGEK